MIMKCLNCGAELSEDTKFCSYCGAKVEGNTKMSLIPSSENRSKPNKVKEQCFEYWNKSSKFGKLATIGIAVFVILALIAFFTQRIVAGIISIVQIAIVVVAILMKKNIIKVFKSWIPITAIALSFVLIIPYFALFKIDSEYYVKYDWNSIALAEMLPHPESPYGEIISNSEDYLSLDVTKTTEDQYKEYIETCKDRGFTIDTETIGNVFYAYNDMGYKLSLSYYDHNSKMHINLDSAMKMETITWPDSKMAKLLPIPKSTTGNIYSNDEKSFSVYIGNTTIDDYNVYVKACEEKGFTIDAQKKDKTFSAKNADSYKLTVNYEGNKVIYISIAEPDKTETTSKTNKTDSTSKPETSETDLPADNLTIGNCPELAAVLSNKAEIDESYSSFASKYKGKIIEFDGRIDYCTKHGNYNTRFDYLVSAGDYDPNHQIGPTFKFEDVNYYDLNTNLDTVSVGLNVRIIAEVVSFDSNSGLFYLEPVSIKGR